MRTKGETPRGGAMTSWFTVSGVHTNPKQDLCGFAMKSASCGRGLINLAPNVNVWGWVTAPAWSLGCQEHSICGTGYRHS